jgi:CDP-glycerol glycerophosphotransferase
MRDPGSERDSIPSRAGKPPLLSIVIPTLNVEAYIGSCIDAIAEQAFRDIEIIVVDGASTDGTRTELEDRIPHEPRLNVQWEASGIGPGRARNAGVRAATGEYLWFVDADDLVAPDSLAAISERLTTRRPDVLLIDHADLQADGSLKPGQDHSLVSGAGGEQFTIADQPRMLGMGLVTWNKIIRREFFESAGAEFSVDAPHEDVPVSCELLLNARAISVLDRACYLYRRQRPGSVTSTGKRYRHFLVFDAWRPILKQNRDKLAALPADSQVTREVYHALFQRAIWHCSTILETAGYIARPDRRAFLDQLSALYSEYVPEGYRPPGGFRGVKFALIAKDSYLGYAALEPLNKARVAAKGLLPRR